MALNVVRVPAGVDYAKVLLLSDAHVGHKCFNERVLDTYLERAQQDNAYILILGDLIEAATKTSPGKSYEDTNMCTNDQVKYWRSKLMPHKERIVGAVIGNHEERLQVDVMETICESLQAPYFGYSGIVTLATEKGHACAYSISMAHGSGGGIMPGGAVNAARREAWNTVADAFVLGHVHKVTYTEGCIEEVDLQNKREGFREQVFITNGHLLDHRLSYGDMKRYPRTRPKQVILKFSMLSRNRGMWMET